MKLNKILQPVFLISGIFLLSSCRTARNGSDNRYPQTENSYPDRRHYPSYPVEEYPVYPAHHPMPPGQAKKIYGGTSARPYAPGQRKKYGYPYRRYPLVIIRTPDIVISRYPDGRYFYRNPEGWIYWMEQDNRFYLDENYLNRNAYDDEEYRMWQNKGKKKENIEWNQVRDDKEKNRNKKH